MNEPTRKCPHCGEYLPLTPDFFHRHGARLHYVCRACTSRERKAKYAADPEKYKARSRAYRLANPDKVRETQRRNHLRNREARLNANRLRYLANREKRLAYAAEQRMASPAKALFREWRSAGCLVCGESDVRVIQAHHIDPSQKESIVSQMTNPESLAKELSKCVPLCANHHILVHHELRNGQKGRLLEEIIAYLRGQ